MTSATSSSNQPTILNSTQVCVFGQKLRLHSFVLSEDPENENYQTLAARLWPQYLVRLSHFFLPIISIYKVQDREKEDAFPLYFEDMMTGHWAGSYYRLIHNYSIYFTPQ